MMHRVRRISAILVSVSGLVSSIWPAAAAGPDLAISVAGEQKILYEWSRQRCEDEYIPDSPARAFRRADGKVVVIASHRNNWSLVGDDFYGVKPACKALMRSGDYPAGTGRLWIQGTYTFDGVSVAALVSQDLSVETKRAGCSVIGDRGRCWLNRIVGAVSTDMGSSFTLDDPTRRTVVSIAEQYPADAQKRFGAFTTTNIVKKDDHYYMITYLQGSRPGDAGNCLFRTDDPMRPEGWRAWDGKAFSLDMRSGSHGIACKTILPHGSEARSLSYSTKHKAWIAVYSGRYRLAGDADEIPGFYFATSGDLMSWSPVRRIMAAPIKPRENRMDQFWYYPSLIDPASSSRNYDTIEGDEAVLLFTVTHLIEGRGTMNRDLQYVPVRLH